MTLVAGLSIRRTPAFFGDLLVSWGIPVEVTLPTQRRPGIFPGANGSYASGLAQKLVIVRPYLLVAWAGKVSTAVRLIAQLDNDLPQEHQNLPGDLTPIFDALEGNSEDVEIVALFFDGRTIFPFCVHTQGFELDGRRIYLLGSGRQSFLEFTQWPDETIPDHDDSDGVVLRATMLRFAADAMLWQYGSGRGLYESWGGGFEIAHVSKTGFVKIDNVLIRGWAIRGEEVLSVGVSFLLHYEGADLLWTNFGEEERTLTIPSMVPSHPRGRPRALVIPEWTVDLFDFGNGSKPFSAVEWHRPGSPSHAEFHFHDGALAEYKMSEDRFKRIVALIRSNQSKPGFSWHYID